MKRFAPFFLLAALAGCGGNSTDSSAGLFTNSARDSRQREEAISRATRDLTAGPAAKVVTATNDFGYRLLQEVDAGDGNVMISPLSVSTALTMTMNGAAGKTREEMQKALGVNKLTLEQVNEASLATRNLLGSVDPTKATLRVANSIWAREGYKFEAPFLAVNSNAFNAKISTVDLGKAEGYREINDWVKGATEGKIPTIISEEPNPDLRMVLVNAVYFKANWKDKFDAEATKSAPFHVSKEQATPTDFMTRRGMYGFAKNDWATSVSMPYADGRFEMVLTLPAEGADFDKFVKRMATEAPTVNSAREILLSLPKWKSSYEKELKSSLTKLGMPTAFTDGADFSLISKEEKLLISKVLHKSFVEVNEAGTEAAAATGVEMETTSAPAEPTVVRFDRPFLYSIRDSKTGQVLFLGIMRNPSK